ncbi:MAG: hypothetical protein Kow00122_12010 [Thermoleophilia bacterium]
MAAHGESQELELGTNFALEAPLPFQSGAAGRGEEGPQLSALSSGRPGRRVQAIVQERQSPEQFGAAGLQGIEGAHPDEVLSHGEVLLPNLLGSTCVALRTESLPGSRRGDAAAALSWVGGLPTWVEPVYDPLFQLHVATSPKTLSGP